jgi:hypothetical protein
MHALAPENADALFLLAKSWASYGFAFVEDDLQAAEDAGDDERAEALRATARAAYDRAIGYGVALLSQRAHGFDDAKSNEQAFVRWLAAGFTGKDDALALLWTGQAWLTRVNVERSEDDGPAFISEAWVGAALIERAVTLDPSAEHYAGVATLGAYDSSTAFSPIAKGKELFDRAIAETGGRDLLPAFLYATTYACVRGDRALYGALLTGILKAEDPDPEQRLENAIAKRRARRWLAARRAKDACGIDTST